MTYRRVPVQDEYADEGGRAVFHESRVIVLSALGDALLTALDDGLDSEEALAARLSGIFGPPADGDALGGVRAGLAELADHGLVRSEG